eukprot:11200233-Lingulodinium_polyedra.AAC.1
MDAAYHPIHRAYDLGGRAGRRAGAHLTAWATLASSRRGHAARAHMERVRWHHGAGWRELPPGPLR